MLTITFFILAAFFKAVADTLQHHFYTSVFKNLDAKWWDPGESWQFVKFLPLTRYRPDAWHLANSGMIFCFACAAVFNDLPWHWALQVAALGTVFIQVFNLFYDRIFKD